MRIKQRNTGAILSLAIFGVLMVFPFLWQIKLALSSQSDIISIPPQLLPSQLQWSNFTDVFRLLPFERQFLNTTIITAVRTIGQVVLCSMAGYAFARMQFPMKRVVLAVLLSILMVPGQVYVLPQYQIVQSLGWLNTLQGIVAPGIFSAFGTFLMVQVFRGMPRELEEAARLDGCNPWQTFWRVMLPLAKPGIISLVIITILASWSDLLWPLIIASDPDMMTLSAGLATLQGYQGSIPLGVGMAAALMAMAPILIMFILLQRRVIEGIAFNGLK